RPAPRRPPRRSPPPARPRARLEEGPASTKEGPRGVPFFVRAAPRGRCLSGYYFHSSNNALQHGLIIFSFRKHKVQASTLATLRRRSGSARGAGRSSPH